MIYREMIQVVSKGEHPTFHDLTDKVSEICARSGIQEGICTIVTTHTTCSVITGEYAHDFTENGTGFLQQDLCNIMEQIIPTCRAAGQYLHPGPNHIESGLNDTQPGSWSMLNTDAHLRSALIGRDVTLIVRNGQPDLGDYACVYFIDWDQVRARPRRVTVQVMGE